MNYHDISGEIKRYRAYQRRKASYATPYLIIAQIEDHFRDEYLPPSEESSLAEGLVAPANPGNQSRANRYIAVTIWLIAPIIIAALSVHFFGWVWVGKFLTVIWCVSAIFTGVFMELSTRDWGKPK